MDLLLRGTVVTPKKTLESGWVAVEGGKIAAIGPGDGAPEADQTVDHGAALILPGVVDGQTHATSCKGMEGIAETTRGAIAGGVTTLVDMPYDNPAPLDRAERLAGKVAAIAEHAHADMALYGTATRETGTKEMQALIDGGNETPKPTEVLTQVAKQWRELSDEEKGEWNEKAKAINSGSDSEE